MKRSVDESADGSSANGGTRPSIETASVGSGSELTTPTTYSPSSLSMWSRGRLRSSTVSHLHNVSTWCDTLHLGLVSEVERVDELSEVLAQSGSLSDAICILDALDTVLPVRRQQFVLSECQVRCGVNPQPQPRGAREAADAVAARHCRSTGKGHGGVRFELCCSVDWLLEGRM